MADKRKSSNDKATSGGIPVEPVYPHLTRAIIAFCILGVLGHFPFHVFGGGAKKLMPDAAAAVIFSQCVPAVFLKATSPMFIQRIPNNVRMIVAGSMGFVSMVCPIIAYYCNEERDWSGPDELDRPASPAATKGFVIVGALFSAVAAAFGEVTVLARATPFPPKIVNAFSAGNGFAGLIGALWMLFFIYVVFPIKAQGAAYAPLLVTGFTIAYPLVYFYLVPEYDEDYKVEVVTGTAAETKTANDSAEGDSESGVPEQSMLTRVWALGPYMYPLTCTYICTYSMALGILTAYNRIYDDDSLYLIVYMMQRVGIFVGRATTQWLHVTERWHLWFFPGVQFIALILQLFNGFYKFLPVWILYPLFLWHGLVGGAIYSNTMLIAKRDIDKRDSKFALGVIATAYDFGRMCAAGAGIKMQPAFEGFHGVLPRGK